ncbi:homogentisate 1,2-dioxygenase [Tanacetum coccineum]
MEKCAFCNADGDFLVVPQQGKHLHAKWAMDHYRVCGKLQVSPGEVIFLPQGFRFSVDLSDGPSRGYVAEVFGTHFQLLDLGPIGVGIHLI